MIVACSDNDATTHCMLVGVGATRSRGRCNHIHDWGECANWR